MISANNIWIKYGDRVLLDNINVVIGERDRVGLVGRNGAGKSTFLKVIAKEISPDKGTIARPTNSTIGFLHQEMSLPKGKTVMNEALSAFSNVIEMEKRIEEMNVEMGERTDYESQGYTDLLNEFAEVNDIFNLLGGATMEADCERVLTGLGFKSEDMDRLTEEFSGGWQMRIALAKILLTRPDYMLLDEPTNHLDIESIIWLEGFLKTYEGAIILISHDKTFLDRVTNRTVEIDHGKVYDYKSNYSKYLILRKERREQLLNAYKNQQKHIEHTEKLIDKFRAKASKAKLAQTLIKQLEKIDRVELDQENTSALKLYFPPAPRSGEVVLDIKSVKKEYGDLLVLDQIDFQLLRGEQVAFVGKNGEGKTTLSKIIVGAENATAGDVVEGHNVKIGYYAQNQADELDGKLTVLETMEQRCPDELRTKLRGILGAFMFSGEDAEKKVSVLSGGERARLAIAKMLLHPINLLILDEPTNHLDIISKQVLKDALAKYDGSMIVVSHDRDFLDGMTQRTIEFNNKKIHEHLGDINYFLERRAFGNFREVSLGDQPKQSKHKSAEKKEAPVILSKEQRRELEKEKKQLLRAVQSNEKKISQTEEKIAQYEAEMAKPDFYNAANANDTLNAYNQSKANLDKHYTEWETAQNVLEAWTDKHKI